MKPKRNDKNAMAKKIAALAELVTKFLANEDELLVDHLLKPLISGAATKPAVRSFLRNAGNIKKVVAELERQKKK